jgi:sulfate transport system ATP-binding protein
MPDRARLVGLRGRARVEAATAACKRGVGFVFQHFALFRYLSVFENVAFGMRVAPRATRLPSAQIRDRVLELLDLVQLEGFARRFPPSSPADSVSGWP